MEINDNFEIKNNYNIEYKRIFKKIYNCYKNMYILLKCTSIKTEDADLLLHFIPDASREHGDDGARGYID